MLLPFDDGSHRRGGTNNPKSFRLVWEQTKGFRFQIRSPNSSKEDSRRNPTREKEDKDELRGLLEEDEVTSEVRGVKVEREYR